MSTYHYLPLDLSEVKAEINAAVKEAFAELEKKQSAKPVDDEIYTLAQAAKKLNVCIKTLSNWRNEGLIKAGKTGGRVSIKRSDIESCIVALNSKKPRP